MVERVLTPHVRGWHCPRAWSPAARVAGSRHLRIERCGSTLKREAALTRRPSAMRYRADIDGLRCIAVLLVLVFHFQAVGAGKAGFIGVDVFFVISGFLISSIVWSQLEQGRFSLGSFYLRRFRRLAPALVCVQVCLLAFALLFLLPGEVSELARQSLATQTYLINFYLWQNINYFGLQSGDVPLLHCWSLAVEEQIYVLYPVVLMLIHRYARRSFLTLLSIGALASFAINLVFVRSHPEATFYLLPTRA